MDPTDWNSKKSQEHTLDFDPFKPGAVKEDHDPMALHLQKSIIASTISGARATLNEPSRPFTPADLPRHLFSGNDYSERPGSAYKVGQVANDAIENFTRSSTAESNIKGGVHPRPGSRSRKNPILEPIVRKKEPAKKNKIVLKKAPSGNTLGSKTLNTFKGGQPVKVLKTKSSDPQSSLDMGLASELNLNDWEIGKTKMQKNQDDAYKKQQELMESMQKAKQEFDIYIEDPDEDDMEKLFLENMSTELQVSSTHQSQDQYSNALEKLEEIKKNQPQEELTDTNKQVEGDDYLDQPEDDMEQKLLNDIHQSMKQETQQDEETKYEEDKTEFEIEYAKLIQEFSNIINNPNRKAVDLILITELSERVWNLIDEWRNQDPASTEKCYKETLLKGILALIDNKNPKAVFRLCKCCIHIIDSIFNEKLRLSKEERWDDQEFIRLFNSLLSTVKILFRYSKGDEHDELYESEKIYDELLHILTDYYIEGRSYLDELTMKILKKSTGSNIEVKNTNATFDMLIYIVGLLKNSSINKANQNILHNKNAIQVLSKLCKTVLNEEESSNAKIPQLFVQITGAYRNLAVDPQHIEIFIEEGALVALSQMMNSFKEHKELSLNIVRILSKISLNYEALDVMNLFGDEFILTLSEIMMNNTESNSILIRAAFVLGNLTTIYSESRLSLLKDGRFFTKLLEISQTLFENDVHKKTNPDKKVDFNRDSTEDALTKVIRLIANLLTEPQSKKLIEINKKKVEKYFRNSMQALQSKNLGSSEEWILNIIACFTNFLFYDTGDFTIFTEEKWQLFRQNIIKRVGLYIFQSDNDELRIESMRVLCNLSRNKEWWSLIVDSETLLKVLVEVLDSKTRDLLFYNVGLLINIALNPTGKKKVTKMCLSQLISILKESNIEDMDLSKVICKALISFCDEKFLWDNSDIQATDDIWSEIGEDLDSIMDVANENEKEILMQLRYLINQVINNLPEITFNCKKENWGRKFKSDEELLEHYKRRHGGDK